MTCTLSVTYLLCIVAIACASGETDPVCPQSDPECAAVGLTMLAMKRQISGVKVSLTDAFEKPSAYHLKTEYDDKCMDYNMNDGNLYMNVCHEGNNQQFYFEGEALKTLHDDKCADYHMGNQNIYMGDCHSGSNQDWYFDGKALKSRHDNRCMDYHTGNQNVYVGDCHDGANLKWYFDIPESTAAAPATSAPATSAAATPAPASVCPMGQGYSDAAAGCAPCLRGSFSGSESEYLESCHACSEGSYSNNEGATICEPCTNGFMAPMEGSTACVPDPSYAAPACDKSHYGAADHYGDSCDVYDATPDYCAYPGDDEDFTAADMCCECKEV